MGIGGLVDGCLLYSPWAADGRRWGVLGWRLGSKTQLCVKHSLLTLSLRHMPDAIPCD